MATKIFTENIQEQILKEINAATESIFVAMAYFTDNTIFNALCIKARDGVKVEVIIQLCDINTDVSIDHSQLEQHGGKILFLTNIKRKKMHHKFCVIDSMTTINGSYNWTNQAKENDEDIQISWQDEENADTLVQRFNKLKVKFEKTDLKMLLSRLKMIEALLELQEHEELETQIAKLKSHMVVPYAKTVLSVLERRDYQAAYKVVESLRKYPHENPLRVLEATYDPAVELRKKLMAKLGVAVASAEEANV